MNIRITFLTCALTATSFVLAPAPASAQDTTRTVRRDGNLHINVTTPTDREGKDNAMAVLKAAGTFKTFLALAERAKLTTLLTGTMIDSTPVDVAVKAPENNVTLNNMKVSGGPPGAETLVRKRALSQLGDALAKAFTQLHAQPGVLTIFAPTDAAFAKLPKKELAAMKADSALAAAVVRTHITTRGIYSKSFPAIERVGTLQGYSFPFTPKTIGDAEFVGTDLIAGNALIHSLGAVLRSPAGGVSTTKP